jgi:biotin carboxyl carrier protein
VKYIVSVAGEETEVEVDGDRVTVGGKTHATTFTSVAGTPLRQLLVDGQPSTLAVDAVQPGRWGLTHQGERWEVEVIDERTRYIRSLTGGSGGHRGGGTLKAPMPGLVLRVQVAPGQNVAAGTGVIVLEAMKMENELKAVGAGVVRSVRVSAGEAVEKGQVLIEFEADHA